MKLAINGRFLTQSVTGVQKVAIEFVMALDRMLVNGDFHFECVDLYVPSRQSLKSEIDLAAINLREVGRFKGHLWEQFDLPRHVQKTPLICLGNTAPIRSLLSRNVECVTMIHDLSYRYFPDAYNKSFRIWYSFLIPLVLRYSSRVITVSEAERKAILRIYGRYFERGKLIASQNGGISSDAKTYSDQVTGYDERDNSCLYVGSLTKRKNADGLIRASIRLAQEYGINTVFIGDTGKLFEKVKRNVPDYISNRISFLGQIDDANKVSEHYQKARVFIFPSFYEASPLPPIEAMSYGLPTVVSPIPSLKERCGDASVYCDPNDVDNIVQTVAALAQNRDKWLEYQHRGSQQAKKYAWEKQVRDVLNCLKDKSFISI